MVIKGRDRCFTCNEYSHVKRQPHPNYLLTRAHECMKECGIVLGKYPVESFIRKSPGREFSYAANLSVKSLAGLHVTYSVKGSSA